MAMTHIIMLEMKVFFMRVALQLVRIGQRLRVMESEHQIYGFRFLYMIMTVIGCQMIMILTIYLSILPMMEGTNLMFGPLMMDLRLRAKSPRLHFQNPNNGGPSRT